METWPSINPLKRKITTTIKIDINNKTSIAMFLIFMALK